VAEEAMTSAQRKLKRGIEQVRTLLDEVRSYEKASAYLFSSEREIRSETEAVYRCFATRQVAMPMHWPLLAGEAIQNLRSALDHLVYEKSGGKSSTSFPIFTGRNEYEGKAPYSAPLQAPLRERVSEFPKGVHLKWDDHGTHKELGEGRQQISTFAVRATGGGVEDVTVETLFSYEVRIEGRPISTLKGIGHEVYRVMTEIETGGKLDPFAPLLL
jgi:hypothetical protein